MTASLRRSLPESALAAGLFLLCFLGVHHWFWGGLQIVDWPGYQDDARAILDHGLFPYRDFPVEYPPLSLPVFLLPAAFANYASAFAWLMAVCGVAMTVVVAAIDKRAAFYAALAPVLVGSLVLSRFDLWPVLLVVVALLALVEGEDAVGWGFLGAAVAAKLWPLVIVPIALAWSIRRGHRRAPLAGLAVVVVVSLPFAVVAPHGLWASVHGQADRPLQIESLGAAFLTVFSHPHVITTHGSQNVAGHGLLAAVFALAQLLALAVCWLGFARRPQTRNGLLTSSAAAVAAFVAFGKVLSPQYLLWLIPLVPLAGGARRLPALLVLTAACVLTQIWFPLRYFAYATSFHLAGVVLARDLALVALYVVLVWPVSRPRLE
jgi:Glycosyltransferase family 87